MCMGRLMDVRIGIMIVFTCFLPLCVATFLPVAYIFTLGTLESMLDEITYKCQGLSSTFKASNFYFEMRLSRRVRTLRKEIVPPNDIFELKRE